MYWNYWNFHLKKYLIPLCFIKSLKYFDYYRKLNVLNQNITWRGKNTFNSQNCIKRQYNLWQTYRHLYNLLGVLGKKILCLILSFLLGKNKYKRHYCGPSKFKSHVYIDIYLFMHVYSVMSYSCSPVTVWPGLFCSWDFPGMNSGECHFLLQGIFHPAWNLPPLPCAIDRQILYQFPGHLGKRILSIPSLLSPPF